MNGLERWIAAYLAMDERRRRENLPFMERTARRYPDQKRPPVPPKLALVPGAQVISSLSGHTRSVVQNLSAPLNVCRIIVSK